MLRTILTFFVFCLFSTNILNIASAHEVFTRKNCSPTIGIISAVPGESGRLLELMESPTSCERGRRTYHKGKLYGIDTVLVASRIGKVAAAATAAHLIFEYKVDVIIFTGVAGAIDPSLNVGDVVIANALIQHDMDARPFCPIYEIPLLKIKECYTDPLLVRFATQASQEFVEKELTNAIPASILDEFHIATPKVITGLVITGDQVISQEFQKVQLRKNLPSALCVEMEGASVSQICYEYDVPCAVIRTISDYANHERTPTDVKKFVNHVSGYYSLAIIKNMYAFIHSHIGQTNTELQLQN